jgi:hypothetical protein
MKYGILLAFICLLMALAWFRVIPVSVAVASSGC